MSSSLKIYSDLYDLVESNMQNSGLDMFFTKGAYMMTIELEPKEVDILKMIELNNEEFVQAAYVGLLRRVPDEKAVQQWGLKSNNCSKRKFQRMVINSLMKSDEFLYKGIIVRNNIYSENILQQQIVLSETNDSPNLYMIKLYKIYHKLPSIIKKLARFIVNKIV